LHTQLCGLYCLSRITTALCHVEQNKQMLQSSSDRATKQLSHHQRLAVCFMQQLLGNLS
jgi:hypothetical protein